MSNKGLKLRFCKECNKKKFCTRISIPNYNFKYTCNKNHSWIITGFTLERMNAALKDTFNSETLKNLFNRDDVFYKQLKNK